MLPELGKYAAAVMWSYAASTAMIVALIAWSLWRGAQIKRALAEVEARAANAKDGAAL
ncbi:MAG: heme exporter protein CcmD [Cypionkella sp.]|nr:heme exporter protein CcmD [Cypionkella sp.]